MMSRFLATAPLPPTTSALVQQGSKGEFDFQKFNSGDYESSVADQQRAETISAVLIPTTTSNEERSSV